MIASPTNNGPHAVRWVYLDGVAMKHVSYANEETGEVTCDQMDENGVPKVVGGEIASITYTGHVVIELNYGWRYNTVSKNFVLLPKTSLH